MAVERRSIGKSSMRPTCQGLKFPFTNFGSFMEGFAHFQQLHLIQEWSSILRYNVLAGYCSITSGNTLKNLKFCIVLFHNKGRVYNKHNT